MCVPAECPPFEEMECDLDCETVAHEMDKCGCVSMKCVPIDPNKVPNCDKCYVAKKTKKERCEIMECAPKQVLIERESANCGDEHS